MQIPSDDGAATLHALFPTLVYQAHSANCEQWRPLFESQLAESGFTPEQRGSRHFAGEYHGRILLHQQPALRPFFEELSTFVCKYLNELGMKPEFFHMQCLKTWFVICSTSQGEQEAMVTHNHSCSDISWVYYLDVPDDRSSPIRFHAGRSPETAPFGSAFHYDWHNENKSAIKRRNWWNRESTAIHPKPGDLLLFPGHQLHSIDANKSDQHRISIAGDIALTLRDEYQDLEFGRTAPGHWLTVPLDQKQ